jgi:AraC-like DNA-binding protein
VWRPFPREVADIVAVEDGGGDIPSRMHPWFGITLARSRGVATIEARREVVLDRNWIVLVPGFDLFALRQQREGEGAVTLLLHGSHLEGLGLFDQPALVTDAALGEMVSALVAQWQRPVCSDGHATRIRSVLERLVARGTPLSATRPQRISALVPVRDYLRAKMSQPVATEELSRLSGLSESYLIRAFHYEFGLPPHAYHLRVRLAAACELLSGGLAVASVAYECGFADQGHLSRKFKAVYGLTPAAWATAASGGIAYDGRPEPHEPLRRLGRRRSARAPAPEAVSDGWWH